MKRKFKLLIFISMIIFIGIKPTQGQKIPFEKMQQEKIANDKLSKALKAESGKKEIRFEIKASCSGEKEVLKTIKDAKLPTDEILVVYASGIPSSGYKWILESDYKNTLELIVENLGPSEIPGANAENRFVLKGVAKGTTSLKFVYKRPWETTNPLKEYILNVTSEGEYQGNFHFENELPQTAEVNKEEPVNKALPSSFDWRSSNKVTPIKNQGNSSACWAFGTCASTESAILISGGASRDLSEQYLCNCDPSSSCSTGGWFAHWLFMDGNRGAVYESQVPFYGTDYACGSYTYHEKITKWGWTDGISDTGWPQKTHNASNTQIKEAIYNYGPVAASCYSDCWANSAGIQTVNCTGGAHIILIVGWNDASGGYWIVKNSWGTSWGHNGYLYLAYNRCDMGRYSTYVTMTAPTCDLSINLTATSITSTSAYLDWAPPTSGGQASWNIQYRALGSSTWTTKASSASYYSLSGLTQGTTYEWAVQTVCSNGGVSAWTASSTFTTTGNSTCPLSINLASSSITETSAYLDWAPPTEGGHSSWNVRYRASGSSAWTTKASSASYYSLSGLTQGTTYEWAVQTVCTSGSTSAWTNSSTFQTTGGGGCSYCASSGTSQQYEWITGVTVGNFSNTSASNAGYGDFTSKTINLAAGSNVSVTLTPNTTQYTEAFKVWIDYNKDCDFDDAGEQVFSGSAKGNTTGSFTVSASASGTTRMRVSMSYSTAPSGPCVTIASGEVEDYTVNFGTAPTSCGLSINLEAESITENSAYLDWDPPASGGQASWNVRYRATGSTTWITMASAASNYSLSGLTANTSYEFSVQTVCTDGTTSNWTASSSFTTSGSTTGCTGNYCASASNRSSYEHIKEVKVGSFTNASAASNYSDFTSQNINITKGQATSITLTPGFASGAYNEYFRMWIDLNADCDFDDPGEMVFDAGSAQNTAVSSTITIPTSAISGTTRMRVSMKYNAAPNVCDNGSTYGDGEVEDYTVNLGNSASSQALALTKELRVNAYPNPVTQGEFTIKTNVDNYSIKIVDLTGRTVFVKNSNNMEERISVRGLNGLYLLFVESGEETYNQEIVIK